MEIDERKKIDLKQYAMESVSKGYLLRIIIYVVVLIVLGCFIYFFYNRKNEPVPLKNSSKVKEITGVTLSDSH